MNYTAGISWQAGDHGCIDTLFNGFSSVTEACKFANWDLGNLRIAPSNDRLLATNKSTGEEYEIFQDQVVLRKHKDPDNVPLVVYGDSMELSDVQIVDYWNTPGIDRTFGSLHYFVLDSVGNSVDLTIGLNPGSVFDDEEGNKYLIVSVNGNILSESYNCIVKKPGSDELYYKNRVHPSLACASTITDQEAELKMFLKLVEKSGLEFAWSDAAFIRNQILFLIG